MNNGKKKRRKIKRLREVWDSSKCTNTEVVGVPEGKREKKKLKNYLKKKNSWILPKFDGKH